MKYAVLLLAIASVATLCTTSAVAGNETHTDTTVPRTCMAGYELVNGTCHACVPGMFNAYRGGRCLGCVNGFFSNASNSTSCVDCGPNERSILPRNDEKTCHCKVGFGGATLSIYDDRAYCIRCDVGFFSTGALPDDGSVAQREMCEECPPWTSTNNTHSTRLSDCTAIAGNVVLPTTPSHVIEMVTDTAAVVYVEPSHSTQASDCIGNAANIALATTCLPVVEIVAGTAAVVDAEPSHSTQASDLTGNAVDVTVH